MTGMTGPDCAVMCNLINTHTHTHTHTLAEYFQPWGWYGVVVSSGVEIMELTATLGFEEGCTILSYDGASASKSIYRHRFLPAQAEIVLAVVPYASNLYAREPQNSCLH